jgi:hypothetical protein
LPLPDWHRTCRIFPIWLPSQVVNKGDLFGHRNQFLIGTSYDQGDVKFNAGSELGFFLSRLVVQGAGIFLTSPTEVAPKDIATKNEYVGVYFADTFDCSDPNNPCLIESFLVSDPPLYQVVSHTWEAGIRGERTSKDGRERLEWSAGLFRTLNTDDIITVFSPLAGRGVFENGGDTLRQGIEANLAYQNDRWFMYANYAFRGRDL